MIINKNPTLQGELNINNSNIVRVNIVSYLETTINQELEC